MPFEGVKQAPPPLRGERTAAAPKPRTSGKFKERESSAAGVFQILGLGAVMVGWHADAGAIKLHGPGMSTGAARLAENNPKIAAGLDKLNEIGPYSEIIALTLPFALQIMANHGLIKPELVAGAGVVHPDALAAEVRTQLAKQAAEAVQAQKEAEEELKRLTEEMAASTNGTHPDS